jgi:hypothetical protein
MSVPTKRRSCGISKAVFPLVELMGRINEGTNQRRNESTNQRRDESTKERINEEGTMKTIIVGMAMFLIIPGFLICQTAFRVKGVDSDSLLVVKDNGNVGVGTTDPLEKLEVNGAMKIGNTAQQNEGTVRYNSGTFEGYASSAWYPLNNEIYMMGPEVPIESTTRGSNVDFANTAFTIPATGWYLIVINALGYNANSYNVDSGNYDQNGFLYLKKTTDPAGLYIMLHQFFFSYIDIDGTVATIRYIWPPLSLSLVRQFNAGDEIILGALVNANGSPGGSWGFTSTKADVIRIK